jgi:hypothetical protein
MDRDKMMTWEGPERVFNEMAEKAAKWDKIEGLVYTIPCEQCPFDKRDGYCAPCAVEILVDALEEPR